jgi:hypothetical protein
MILMKPRRSHRLSMSASRQTQADYSTGRYARTLSNPRQEIFCLVGNASEGVKASSSAAEGVRSTPVIRGLPAGPSLRSLGLNLHPAIHACGCALNLRPDLAIFSVRGATRELSDFALPYGVYRGLFHRMLCHHKLPRRGLRGSQRLQVYGSAVYGQGPRRTELLAISKQ